MKRVRVSGVDHIVRKEGGDIIVEHPDLKGGKWDKVNLTKQSKGKVKSLKKGIKSTKEWHAENPHPYKDRIKSKKK